MEKVDFAVDGKKWLLAAGSVDSLTSDPSEGRRWDAISRLSHRANGFQSVHSFVRFEFRKERGLRRWFGLLLPSDLEEERDSWHQEATSIFDNGTDPPFLGVDPPSVLRELPTRGYVLAGQHLACPFTLTTLLESLLSDRRLADTEWSVQFNATRHAPTTEEIRSSRKTVARLQNLPGVPPRFLREQQNLLREAEGNPWKIVELIAAPDQDAFNVIASVIDQEFAVVNRDSHFAPLDWSEAPSGEIECAWMTGLVPEDDAIGGEESILPALHSDEIVAALWTVRAPAARRDSVPAAFQPRVSKPDVFISYSTRDTNAAFETCHYLEERGISCWIAPRDISPGSEWPTEIVAGIKASQFTVVLVSEGSNLSRYVMRELEITVNENHPIIPIKLETCRLRDPIEFFLSSQQWVDATAPPFEDHLANLAETLSRLK